MTDAELCRKYAYEARELAERSASAVDRAAWLKVAETWMNLARQSAVRWAPEPLELQAGRVVSVQN